MVRRAVVVAVVALVLVMMVAAVGGASTPKRKGIKQLDPLMGMALNTKDSTMTIASDNVADDSVLDYDSTCFAVSGYPSTPEVSWSGAPDATVSYMVGFIQASTTAGEGSHVFWWMYNVDASVTEIAYNSSAGTVGINDEGDYGYYAPCAGGGGVRYFTLNVFALSASVEVSDTAIMYDAFVAENADLILDSASLSVTYDKETDGPSTSTLRLKRKLAAK